MGCCLYSGVDSVGLSKVSAWAGIGWRRDWRVVFRVSAMRRYGLGAM